MDVPAGTSAGTGPHLVPAGADGRPRKDLRAKLNRPISTWMCVLGWVVATAIFLGLVASFGGPSGIDTGESVYGTWAVAHGNIGCVYPAATLVGEPPIAPLYLVLSGAVAAAAGVGDPVPFRPRPPSEPTATGNTPPWTGGRPTRGPYARPAGSAASRGSR